MKQILQEENIRPPRRGSDGGEDGLSDKPVRFQINHSEHEDVDRPDAQDATAVEIAKVMRPLAGFEKDRSDEESREDKEEVDPGPSPERGTVEPCSFKAWMAVVEDHSEYREAAQALQFRDVERKPSWALDRQGRRVNGLAS